MGLQLTKEMKVLDATLPVPFSIMKQGVANFLDENLACEQRMLGSQATVSTEFVFSECISGTSKTDVDEMPPMNHDNR